MAFTIRETPTRGISGSRDSDNKITRQRVRSFTLDTDTQSDTEGDARSALVAQFGVFEGASYPGSIFFVCNSLSVDQVGPISYEAQASYATRPFTESENPEGDPTLERPRIRYSSASVEVETDVDVDGDPVATATGELYQGVTTTVSDIQITIQKNFGVFSPAAFRLFQDTTNNAAFLGFPAGTCLVKSIDAQEVEQDGFVFWDVSVTILQRRPIAEDVTDAEAWYKRLRHEGYYCFSGGNKDRCRDELGEPVTQPAQLAADGTQIADTATPDFRRFQVYRESNFNSMNLGVF